MNSSHGLMLVPVMVGFGDDRDHVLDLGFEPEAGGGGQKQYCTFALAMADFCYVMEKGHIVSKESTKNLDPAVIKEHLSV